MQNWIFVSLFLLVAIPITLFDLKEYRIPDFLSLGGIAVFILLRLLWQRQPPWIVVLDGAVGFGAFWLIWWVTKGQLGLGDAKYSALIAVAAGLSGWLVALLAASVVGITCVGIFIVIFRADKKMRIPFAPFLTLGATASLLFESFRGLIPPMPF
ncbi:MAG: A24 family peptidase [Spirochaetia bacterium]|jgi:prepilin signal peptidase PulO-like enzyme (type II secretory pathway)